MGIHVEVDIEKQAVLRRGRTICLIVILITSV